MSSTLVRRPALPGLRNVLAWLICGVISWAIAACGGGSGEGDTGTAPSITSQPAAANVLPGGTATFTVVASGSEPMSYQWQKNGAPIAGAAGPSYTTPALASADSGALFVVVVSNPIGTVMSAPVALTVGAPIAPTVAAGPTSTTVTAPATASFSARFDGTPPLAYQWTRNGVAIAGATAPSYTTPSTTVAGDDGALFAVTATNAAGRATTDAARLTVTAQIVPVSIVTAPTSTSVTVGATATFSVTAAGTTPLGYQWFRNGGTIAGATAASYTTPPTVAGDTGTVFKVAVTNAANSVTSADAVLTVGTSGVIPVITTQPASVAPNLGAAVSFSVTANGTAPLTFQWFRDGTAIAGATAAVYTIAAVVPTDNGARFTVTVSNAIGSVTSSPAATLSITNQPPVATVSSDQSVPVGQSATFSVTATGTSPFTYQWRKNGSSISGATVATYTTPAAVQADNNALFTVVVTNAAGNVTAGPARLTVGPVVAPVIDTPPTAASVPNGQTGTFTVAAHGTAPLAYQWRKNGTAILGATAASYTTPIVSFADDQAQFTVVVSNPAATTATSNPAVLTVTLPISPVVQVVAGNGQSVALRRSGAVYSWSDWSGNSSFNAEAGAGAFGYSPGAAVRARHVDNTPFLGVASISAGTTHSVLVTTEGTVWSWGEAGAAAFVSCPIGDGACLTRSYPTQAKDGSGVPFAGAAQVAAGWYYSVAVKTDGTVWAWGENDLGQLGDGSTTGRLNPVQVVDPSTGGTFGGALEVAASVDHALARKSNGTVWAWGRNDVGQIGDGSASSFTAVPKQVEVTPGVTLAGIVAVAAGERHSVALKSDGTVYAWGTNASGALGDGTTTNRPRATVMRDTGGNPITGVVAIAAGQNFSILLKSDGTVLATGQNDIGQLGDNSTAAYQINPVPVRDAAGAVFGSVVGISAYHQHTVVRRSDDTVWAWGLNSSRQLGDTTNVNRRNPVPAPAYVP